jgi:large subunit ribosomal protein L31
MMSPADWLHLDPGEAMKADIHPKYEEVLFLDVTNGQKFIIRSTLGGKEKMEHEGKSYPLFKCDVTSQSHPFYTGEQNKIVDTAGRVDRFNQKFAKMTGKK